MNNKIVMIMAVIPVSIIMITSAVLSEEAFAKYKKSRSSNGSNIRQTISQAKVCGIGNEA